MSLNIQTPTGLVKIGGKVTKPKVASARKARPMLAAEIFGQKGFDR